MRPAPTGHDMVGDSVLSRLLRRRVAAAKATDERAPGRRPRDRGGRAPASVDARWFGSRALATRSRSRAKSQQVLREKKRAENFPVALRILPRALRRDLGAVYDVARVIDDLGDEAAGDRTAALLRFREDLARAWDGQPEEPVLRRLVPTIRARGLELDPFDRLVRANLQDQKVTQYATQSELEGYCELSANPVGRVVLRIFGVHSPEAERLSDLVCTALQLVEHCQDVAEDGRAGRVYLPQDDLAALGVKGAVAAQTAKALEQLKEGTALLSHLHGWARLAIAGYIAGGLATVDALRRADWEVRSGPPRPRKRDVLTHLAILLVRGGGRWE